MSNWLHFSSKSKVHLGTWYLVLLLLKVNSSPFYLWPNITNHKLASRSFTICIVSYSTPSILRPSIQKRKKNFNQKKMEETTVRATQQGSLSQTIHFPVPVNYF